MQLKTSYWIITLNPKSPRTQSLVSALKEQGLPSKIFEAVDGRHTTPELKPEEKLTPFRTRLRRLCDLTPPEIGCYLSHLRLIKQAWEAGEQAICIIEDDVKLEPDFARIMAEIEQLPEGVDMVRLMALKIRKRKIVQDLGKGSHKLVRPERGWLGAQAYYMNRGGMEKVIKHGNSILEPIDKFYDHFWEQGLKLYGVEPHIVFEENLIGSSIQKSDTKRTKVPLLYYWLHPFAKGLFSLRRHLYLIWHRNDFYPATRPEKRMGRSKRIRE